MLPSPALKPTTCERWSAAEAPTPPPGLAARLVLALVAGYKVLLSPHFTGSCRFHPSCADFMVEAVRIHGAARGVALGSRRLARCHPFGGHGFDPVPRKQ